MGNHSSTTNSKPAPKPLLKWVGGKGQLLPILREQVELAGGFGRYHEPFFGGGALFFDLYRRGKLGSKQAYLSDVNPNLIAVYSAVKDDVEAVIDCLKAHQLRHCEEYYYEVRKQKCDEPAQCAARIIYLNKTCFNGLYRENSKGEFNVPIGRYVNPKICDGENLRAVSVAFKKIKIECRPFQSILDKAIQGDLVYFDPPYHPLTKSSSFTSYAKDSFDESCQRDLAECVSKLTRKGVKVLLSNSYSPLIRSLYESDYTLEKIFANRSVNSQADKRGKVPEALVSNY